ncbi:MAG TPA: response regulator [Polyangiales bacterium]
MANKLRVLVIDDDDMVRTHLSSLLTAAHHIVHALPRAIGVTRAVVAHRIDVVAIDVSMPTMSGDKLALLLRQNPRCKDVGVVLVSSLPVDELQRLATEADADAVVSKSDARTKFVAAVEYAARLRGRKGEG